MNLHLSKTTLAFWLDEDTSCLGILTLLGLSSTTLAFARLDAFPFAAYGNSSIIIPVLGFVLSSLLFLLVAVIQVDHALKFVRLVLVLFFTSSTLSVLGFIVIPKWYQGYTLHTDLAVISYNGIAVALIAISTFRTHREKLCTYKEISKTIVTGLLAFIVGSIIFHIFIFEPRFNELLEKSLPNLFGE